MKLGMQPTQEWYDFKLWKDGEKFYLEVECDMFLAFTKSTTTTSYILVFSHVSMNA